MSERLGNLLAAVLNLLYSAPDPKSRRRDQPACRITNGVSVSDDETVFCRQRDFCWNTAKRLLCNPCPGHVTSEAGKKAVLEQVQFLVEFPRVLRGFRACILGIDLRTVTVCLRMHKLVEQPHGTGATALRGIDPYEYLARPHASPFGSISGFDVFDIQPQVTLQIPPLFRLLTDLAFHGKSGAALQGIQCVTQAARFRRTYLFPGPPVSKGESGYDGRRHHQWRRGNNPLAFPDEENNAYTDGTKG